MKRIILCADDYGQNSAISQAIVELAVKNRLSATSCLVTTPDWAETAKALTSLQSSLDIGLHFNLTEGKLLTTESYPLSTLILKASLRSLDKAVIATELRAQLDRFTQTFNRLPDFIDGHQHVHQLPVIRDALFAVYEERLRENNTVVRCTYSSGALLKIQTVAYIKQVIIQLCGGMHFRQALVARKIPHNLSFSGIYSFKDNFNYAAYFPRFLAASVDGGMIMCHPGMIGHGHDTIEEARHREYSYFSSQTFARDLANNHVRLIRVSELASIR
jgi:predicted glycoside hydrolase/deacetylase ChbG (UPF0249 family)